MPVIDTRTANPQHAVTSTAPVSPEAYGSEGFQGLSNLGRSVQAIAEKIQSQKDEADVVGKVGDYRIRLAQLPSEIMADPTLDTPEKRVGVYKEKADEYRQQLSEGTTSHVRHVFGVHATQALTEGIIHMETEDRKTQVQQVRSEGATLQGRLAEREAQHIADGNGAMAVSVRAERMELVYRGVERGIWNPEEGKLLNERAQNQTWESVAQQNPEYMLNLQENVLKGGTPPAGMDHAKLHNYTNIAINTLNASQWQEVQDEKRRAKAQKDTEDRNASALTADVLENKPTGDAISALTRARALDPGWAIRLHELQHKMSDEPDLAKYQKGLAQNIETSLEQQRYDNKPLDPSLAQGLTDDVLQGRILKDEYAHLMNIFRGVEAYKHQDGQEDRNRDISHAESLLVQDLRTTGPADKFDGLSEQTVKQAREIFFRHMKQHPNDNPLDVMNKISGIFKPVIEKRLGISKTDKAVLDDAKVSGLVHLKALSPAAAKARRDKDQETTGWNIVQETLKNLPPPPPPGYFERLQQMIKPKPERKSGVMQGE